ncbi:MAG: o-succinylbenzoate--CoA ligase [Byssovorax sp.]
MDGLRLHRAAADPAVAALPALFTGDRAFTFAELAAPVARLAAGLAARGIGPGSRVALTASNEPATVMILLALIDLGATIVPIHPRLTTAEAEVLVTDAAPDLVLRDADLSTLEASAPHARFTDLDPALPLAMVYTSGTTGKPKGAVLSRRAFLASAAASAQNLGWTAEDRWLLAMPLCHVGGLSIVTRCLLARRPIILLPRFEPAALLESIVLHRATLLSVVPTMLRALLDADRDNVLARLRAVLTGGAAASPALIDACARRGVPALTTYGLTEACSQVASQRPSSPYRPEPGAGRALPGVELRVQHDDPAAPGLIQVRGPTLMSGYWRGPGLPLDPATDADGWLSTGDLGRLDAEGRLFVEARRADLVVTGGENVYPLEVERALESIPGVRAALVFGVPDERWGQVVAAAVERSASLDEGALAAAIKARLAPHKRPRLVCFVAALPTRGPGKLDRMGAPALLADHLRPLP